MQIFSYRTIQQASEGNYKEKGSKFLGFAYPVQSESDVKQKIADLKKEYFDARHHCYAYMLGEDKMKYRAFVSLNNKVFKAK
jgi:putative IMPACT (imprinted ancient) family translation regulator